MKSVRYSYHPHWNSSPEEIVILQCDIAFEYANVLGEEQRKKVLAAIHEGKISAIGIYAYDNNHRSVAECKIEVGLAKNGRIVSVYTYDENITGDISPKEKEQFSKIKEFINSLVQISNQKEIKLGMWVRPVEGFSSEGRADFMKEIGFIGGCVEP